MTRAAWWVAVTLPSFVALAAASAAVATIVTTWWFERRFLPAIAGDE